MYINAKNYLTRLGIQADNEKEKLKTIEDEEIEEAYISKLIDTYALLKMQKQGITKRQFREEEGKMHEIEDAIKDEIFFYIKPLTGKAKILVLENKIHEMSSTNREMQSSEIIVEMYKMAYNALSTKENREEYIKTLIKQKQFNEELYELIKKNGGNPRRKFYRNKDNYERQHSEETTRGRP